VIYVSPQPWNVDYGLPGFGLADSIPNQIFRTVFEVYMRSKPYKGYISIEELNTIKQSKIFFCLPNIYKGEYNNIGFKIDNNDMTR